MKIIDKGHSSKALVIDGWNFAFFKEVWPTIKLEIYDTVKQFFNSIILDKKINHTSITLIPKVSNADQVRLFRLKSCYNVLYNITSKVLTNRLRLVIKDVINPAEVGFIPSKHLCDNVILAT